MKVIKFNTMTLNNPPPPQKKNLKKIYHMNTCIQEIHFNSINLKKKTAHRPLQSPEYPSP